MRVGVDIGGTFTDLFVYNEVTGEIKTSKALSTPPSFVDGVFGVIEKAKIDLADVRRYIGHGSTIVDNALIQRKLPKTALITTKGFRDILEVGRYWRQELYDLQWDKPAQARPLVRRRGIYTVEERIGADGDIVTPLNEEQAREVAKKMHNYESVAVFFVNSYANSIHERKMGEILAEECPDIYVTLSTDLIPTIRELPRLCTTVINACILPIVDTYMKELVRRLKERSFKGELLVIQSNGGVMRSDLAIRRPVYIATSGPAAGVAAAAHMAKLLGIRDIITYDMGGTTVKACIVVGGEYLVTTEFELEWDMPIRVPMMDLVELGAGGGSIAWIDMGGMLRVGPQSAGADPGPACYMRGGTEPTVTDANLVLGRLNPTTFLGGEMKISEETARQAIKEKIAEPLGMKVKEAAMGILEILNVNMTQACRAVTMERGYDPRDFTLIAFGGAGPMHCAYVAEELEISKIIIPHNPGVFSAYGMCTTDFQHDFTTTFFTRIDEANLDRLNEIYQTLEEQALNELRIEGIPEKKIELLRYAKMKYIGERLGWGLETPIPAGTITKEVVEGEIRKKFEELHERRYGFSVSDEPVQFVDILVRGIGKVEKVKFKEWKENGRDASKALKGTRKVYFKEDGFIDTPIYDRSKLEPGNFISGPAVIEEPTSTTVLLKTFNLTVDKLKNLVLTRKK